MHSLPIRMPMLMLAVLACQCASSVSQTSPEPTAFEDLSCLAVVPFANFSEEPKAGEQVAALVANELMVSGRYNVLEPTEANMLLESQTQHCTDSRVDGSSEHDRDENCAENMSHPVRQARMAREVGRRLGVPAVAFGSVLSSTRQDLAPRAEGPEASISFTVTVVRVDSGKIIWNAMVTSMDFPYLLPSLRSPVRLASEMVPQVVAPLIEARGQRWADHDLCWRR